MGKLRIVLFSVGFGVICAALLFVVGFFVVGLIDILPMLMQKIHLNPVLAYWFYVCIVVGVFVAVINATYDWDKNAK